MKNAANIFNKAKQAVLLSAMIVCVCVVEGRAAEYEEALAKIQQCSPISASIFKSAMRQLEGLTKTETKDCLSDYKYGTPGGIIESVSGSLKKLRNDMTSGKSTCRLEDVQVVMGELSNKATSITQKWLNYAEKKKAEGVEKLCPLNGTTESAIKSRQAELIRIRQSTEAITAEDILPEKKLNSAMAALKKCAPKEAEKIESQITKIQNFAHRTNKDYFATYKKGTAQGVHKQIVEILKRLQQEERCEPELLRAVADMSGNLALEVEEKWKTNAIEAGNEKAAQRRQEEIAKTQVQMQLTECPLAADVKAKYSSGCWSCLVLEKVTSAFLHAAKKALPVTQKAGIIVLVVGSGIWLAFWALKNVSSFTEVQIGNILNDLIKFCFKVALAYWFILAGQRAISQYFITPIMSVGAIVGQQFWDEDIRRYTYNWEDEFEPDDPEKLEKVEQQVEENNKKGLGGTNKEEAGESVSAQISAEEAAGGTGVIKVPEPVMYDSTEAMVQDIQKAFIAVLQKQLGEIKNSCGGPCGESCRHKSCSNTGHQNYIRSIFKRATGSSMVDHYCQASITAAMDKLHELIGGEATMVLRRAGAGCLSGIGLGAIGDVKLCENGRQVYNQINVADTVYYHNVMKGDGSGQKVGGTSGHHAVTYTGGGRIISFNGDGSGTLCNSYYYNVTGKVLCVSCLIRKKLKENPQAVQSINTGQLSALARGVGDMSLINYEGGSFSDVGEGSFNSAGYSNLMVDIPDVKYTGPTDIMPKSVMNSILGATRAITNKTSEIMVLGDVIQCYATMENGGAWKINSRFIRAATKINHVVNIFMWLSGFIVWCLGFLLTVAIAYYLVDISFKIGFAVLSLPIVMGLWPFDMTKGKLVEAISIIAKSAATFAFFAITTGFGMAMLEAAYRGGLETIYEAIGSLSLGTVSDDEADELKRYVSDEFSLFSSTFLLMCFSIIYFFKLVRSTLSDLVNKFFPDNVFGDSAPMHSAATMMTSYVKKLTMKAGVGMARDIVTYQAGELARKGIRKGAKGVAGSLKSGGQAIGKLFKKKDGGGAS